MECACSEQQFVNLQLFAACMVAIVLLAIVADAIAEAEANPVAGSSSGQ
jgi:hypothetical protein